MWNISFISEEDFEKHVLETIQKYGEKLKSYDLKKFNSNIIDPIKLVFDKTIYGLHWNEIIEAEIYRQRDKSNNNDIGYFHQNIFKYIKDCVVPDTGWDVILERTDGIESSEGDFVKTIKVEMKNKHNTMNSASGARTYAKMALEIASDDDCACYLVEAISKNSRNEKWSTTLDGQKRSHKKIRKVSLDKFYEIVTGEKDAFYQICMVLPETIEKIINNSSDIEKPNDTVLGELYLISKEKNIPMSMALNLLAFDTYNGFNN